MDIVILFQTAIILNQSRYSSTDKLKQSCNNIYNGILLSCKEWKFQATGWIWKEYIECVTGEETQRLLVFSYIQFLVYFYSFSFFYFWVSFVFLTQNKSRTHKTRKGPCLEHIIIKEGKLERDPSWGYIIMKEEYNIYKMKIEMKRLGYEKLELSWAKEYGKKNL